MFKFPKNEQYPNMGCIWLPEEKEKLFEELKDNMLCLSDISKNHGRTEGAILARLREEAYAMHNGNVDMGDIVSTLRFLSEQQINETILKRNKQKDRKENKDKKISKDEKKVKYNADSFQMLWDFKIYLLSKYDFGTDIHEIFDDFVKKHI